MFQTDFFVCRSRYIGRRSRGLSAPTSPRGHRGGPAWRCGCPRAWPDPAAAIARTKSAACSGRASRIGPAGPPCSRSVSNSTPLMARCTKLGSESANSPACWPRMITCSTSSWNSAMPFALGRELVKAEHRVLVQAPGVERLHKRFTDITRHDDVQFLGPREVLVDAAADPVDRRTEVQLDQCPEDLVFGLEVMEQATAAGFSPPRRYPGSRCRSTRAERTTMTPRAGCGPASTTNRPPPAASRARISRI